MIWVSLKKNTQRENQRQAWWSRPAIPARRRMKQENGEFKLSLGYTERPCLGDGKKEGRRKSGGEERNRKEWEGKNTQQCPVPCGSIVRSLHSHHNQDRVWILSKHRTLHHKSLHAERSWLCPQPCHSILSVIHCIPEWLCHFTVPQQHVSDPTSPELLQHWKPVLSFMLESPVGMCMVLHWGLNFHLRMPGGACHLLAFISLTFLCVFCSYANWIICFRLT